MSIEYELETQYIHYFNKSKTDFHEKEIIINYKNNIAAENKNIINTSKNKNGNPNNISDEEEINHLEDEKSHFNSKVLKENINFTNNNNKNNNNNPASEFQNNFNKNEFDDYLNKEDLKFNNDIRKSNLNFQIAKATEISAFSNKYSLVLYIPIYSETFQSIEKTLEGISHNIEELEKAGIPTEKILILIIQDGRESLNSGTYTAFTQGKLKGKEAFIETHMKEIFDKSENCHKNSISKKENSNLDAEKNIRDLRTSNIIKEKNNFETPENKERISNANNLEKVIDINNKNNIQKNESNADPNFKNYINNSSDNNTNNISALHVNDISNSVVHKRKNKGERNYLVSNFLKINRKTNSENYDAADDEMKKIDVLFCIKKHTRGKMDSSFFLMLGFCRKINPKYLINFDAGMVPEPGRTLVHLITPMENDANIASTCGVIQVISN
jgi:hypothetical protein